jgi:hypothetical protein
VQVGAIAQDEICHLPENAVHTASWHPGSEPIRWRRRPTTQPKSTEEFSMPNTIQRLVRLASGSTLLAAAGWAQAFTLTTTPPNSWANINFSESSNVGGLALTWRPFSGEVEGLQGASVTKTFYGYAPTGVDVVLSAPISAIAFNIDSPSEFSYEGSQLNATDLYMRGGLSLTVGNNRADITNLDIDLVSKQIRADVRVGNVVQSAMTVWSIDNVQGPSSINALDCDFTCDFASAYLHNDYLQKRYLDNLTLTGLRMTQQASDVLTQGLGLTAWAPMFSEYQMAPDWDNHITFNALAVPEADTGGMMALGLAGLLAWTSMGRRSRPVLRAQ